MIEAKIEKIVVLRNPVKNETAVTYKMSALEKSVVAMKFSRNT